MGKKYRRISNHSIRDLVLLIRKYSNEYFYTLNIKKMKKLEKHPNSPSPETNQITIQKIYGNKAAEAYRDFNENNHEFLTDNDEAFKKRFLKDKGAAISTYKTMQEKAYRHDYYEVERRNDQIRQQNKKIKKENIELINKTNIHIFKMENLATELEKAKFDPNNDVIIDLLNGTYTVAPKQGSKPKVIITNTTNSSDPLDYGQENFKMTLSSTLDSANDIDNYQPDPYLGYKDNQIKCNQAAYSNSLNAHYREKYGLGHELKHLLYPAFKIKKNKFSKEDLEIQRVLEFERIEELKKEYILKQSDRKEQKKIKIQLKKSCKFYNKNFRNTNIIFYDALIIPSIDFNDAIIPNSKSSKNKPSKDKKQIKKNISEIKKTTKQKPIKLKSHSSNNFSDISFLNIVLTVVPTLVMLMYVILAFTGAIKDIHFSIGFEPTLFGYNFELSGLALNWFESTKHGFFSAITLGLLQIILIIVGFILDLVIHLIFFLIAILILILMTLLSLGFLYVFPAAIVIWLIIYVIKVDSEIKKFSLIFLLLSLTGCLAYYVKIFEYL